MQQNGHVSTFTKSKLQVLHVANSHWIVASNIDIHAKSYYRNSVCIYDSSLNSSVKKDICQPQSDSVHFDLMSIEAQPNVPKCIGFLRKGHLDHFPCTGQRHVGFGRRITKSVKEELYCSCCMPNDRAIAMIYCDQMYHKQCEGVDPDKSYIESVKW